MNIAAEIANLQSLSGPELARRYEDLFNSQPRSRNPAWLRKRIGFKLQERAYVVLSGPARAELNRLAANIELPKAAAGGHVRNVVAKKPSTQPRPGTVLQREWHGTRIRVEVVFDGFVYDGEHFKSLSAVAKHVTGQHWSGPRFFNLVGRKS